MAAALFFSGSLMTVTVGLTLSQEQLLPVSARLPVTLPSSRCRAPGAPGCRVQNGPHPSSVLRAVRTDRVDRGQRRHPGRARRRPAPRTDGSGRPPGPSLLLITEMHADQLPAIRDGGLDELFDGHREVCHGQARWWSQPSTVSTACRAAFFAAHSSARKMNATVRRLHTIMRGRRTATSVLGFGADWGRGSVLRARPALPKDIAGIGPQVDTRPPDGIDTGRCVAHQPFPSTRPSRSGRSGPSCGYRPGNRPGRRMRPRG